jgi:hypothetical protein
MMIISIGFAEHTLYLLASSSSSHQPMNLHRHTLQVHLKGVVVDGKVWLGGTEASTKSSSSQAATKSEHLQGENACEPLFRILRA